MEQSDNTKPAQRGTYSIGPAGVFSYLPVQGAEHPMQPFLALVIIEKPDGELSSKIDVRWASSALLERIED